MRGAGFKVSRSPKKLSGRICQRWGNQLGPHGRQEGAPSLTVHVIPPEPPLERPASASSRLCSEDAPRVGTESKLAMCMRLHASLQLRPEKDLRVQSLMVPPEGKKMPLVKLPSHGTPHPYSLRKSLFSHLSLLRFCSTGPYSRGGG